MKIEKEKISIIVPVYNVEKYIKRCIESILNQTYSNLEIILIDDGSIDKSGIICDELKKTDNRILVFHKKNEGVSSARNIGIKNASGEYLLFIDSDDHLEKNMIEVLYNNLKSNNADISICEYYIEHENGEIKRRHNQEEKFILGKEDFYNYILKDKYFGGYLFNKLIKRNLIYNKNDTILFNENIHICEDLFFLCRVAHNISKAYYTTTPYYYYMQREDGALRSIYSNKQLSNFYAYSKIIEIYNKNSMPIDIKFEMKFLKFCIDAQFLLKLLKIKDKNLEVEILKTKKQYYKKLKKVKGIRKQDKFKMKLSYYFPYLMGLLKYMKRKTRNGG